MTYPSIFIFLNYRVIAGKSCSRICSATTQLFKCLPSGTLVDRQGIVHSLKLESSELSKHFAEQGVRIPLKHGTVRRRR
jgi:hypothetical protein